MSAIAIASVIAVGCAGPGQGIVDRIRAANSPIVREVSFTETSFWEGSGEGIVVYLIDEATDAQALELWCNVVVPAGADKLPPGRVQLRKGGEITIGTSRTGSSHVLDSATCP